MNEVAITPRRRFRVHAADGAVLFFQPETGANVLVRGEATRAFERAAPRVVMFGVTNACNLRCHFCSRDVDRKSEWTIDSAATVLEGLAAAGTLEVAFGGGEPFAFRGFEALLRRLHATTTLALNVTTNGTLFDEESLFRLRGVIGQVRLSIYDDQPWRWSAALLRHTGHRWGANVLVDDDALGALPVRLAELAMLGATDVSILGYVERDANHQLSHRGRERLARIIDDSPIPCRISVCFGDRLGVSRLFAGLDDTGDCGAGADFLTLTSDGFVQSCSFQDHSVPATTAEDVLRVHREHRARLREASPRFGCARPDRSRPAADGVRVWQGFSGNNSGECILVAKFVDGETARRVLAELAGQPPDEPYGDAWRELFEREGLRGPERYDDDPFDYRFRHAPEEMITVGRTLLAHTEMTMGDDFPELRALSWKRGGEVIPGGVHVHEASVIFAIAARDAGDARSLTRKALPAEAVVGAIGAHLVGVFPTERHGENEPELTPTWRWLGRARDEIAALAGDRPFALEVLNRFVDQAELTDALKKLGSDHAETPRLALSYVSLDAEAAAAKAHALAGDLEGATIAGNLLLIDPVTRKKRLALVGIRQGAVVSSLSSTTVALSCRFRRPPIPKTKGKKAPEPTPIDAEALRAALDDRLRRALDPKAHWTLAVDPTWGGGATASVLTDAVGPVMTALAAHGRAETMTIYFWLEDTQIVDRTIRRLIRDVTPKQRR